MGAVNGYEEIDDEAKSVNRSDLAGYLSKELLDVLAPVVTEVTEVEIV